MQWQRSEIVSCKTSCVSADTPTVKDFAAAFVNAVTIKSERGMIAKNGDESLFSVISQIFPNVSCYQILISIIHVLIPLFLAAFCSAVC